ncbi:hypothetical protein [Streptomyces armeniacus]|nr:hypothetical protein [Streptomyces armeniacus]
MRDTEAAQAVAAPPAVPAHRRPHGAEPASPCGSARSVRRGEAR